MTPTEFLQKHSPTGTDRWAEGARETFAHDLEVMVTQLLRLESTHKLWLDLTRNL